MKYIQTYEKFGYPESISKIRDFLTEFTIDKFNWWLNRSGPANYVNKWTFHSEEIDPSIKKNEDFPVSVINYTIKIVQVQNISSVGGQMAPYRSKRDLDLETSHIYRGKVHIDIECKIYTGFRTIQIGKIKQRIESTITHELQHAYEFYKKSMKGLSNVDSSRAVFSNQISNLLDKYRKTDAFTDLLISYYPFTSKPEYNAFVSEFTAKKITKKMDMPGYKFFIKMLNMDFETLYKKITLEFKRLYPKVDVEKIPHKFVQDVLDDWKLLKIDEQQWIYKFDTDFKTFCKTIHDEIKRVGPKFIKKTDKVFYGWRHTEK